MKEGDAEKKVVVALVVSMMADLDGGDLDEELYVLDPEHPEKSVGKVYFLARIDRTIGDGCNHAIVVA